MVLPGQISVWSCFRITNYTSDSHAFSTGSGLSGTSNISQLTMVPLQDTHAANSVIESDRMLLISGGFADSSFGTASSALFDGTTFIPYIMSLTSSGEPGFISSMFHSFSSFSFAQHRTCLYISEDCYRSYLISQTSCKSVL